MKTRKTEVDNSKVTDFIDDITITRVWLQAYDYVYSDVGNASNESINSFIRDDIAKKT